MIYDGYDIKYLLLKKKGYSLTDIGQQLNVSVENVHQVIFGKTVSKRVINHIEKLLGMAPGTLEISREKRDALVKVA
ncbi:hypothetical protein ES705_39111 [subsurface metagenome]